MKFTWNDDDHKYVKLGLTAFVVVVMSILANQVLHQAPILTVGVRKLFDCLRPILYGLIFAYLLIPLLNLIERAVYGTAKKIAPSFVPNLRTRRVIRFVCVLLTWGITLTMLSILVMLVVPELLSSIEGIISNTSIQVNKLIQWISKVIKENPGLKIDRSSLVVQIRELSSNFNSLMDNLSNILKFIPTTGTLVSNFSNGVISAVYVIFHFAIGIIVSIYVMYSKELFTSQSKKFMYGLFSPRNANRIIRVTRMAHVKFGGFFIGKIIDSIVIGILCFVLLSIFRIPYAVLISFIVGVTNIIPFFGPFIGAIPCAVILLLASPIKCLYFVIIVIVLQQIDGNILGPKILSNSIGLSSFWVMFSILVSGGLFGFWGLLCGVPIFAVIYELVSEFIERRLKNKSLSASTLDYDQLDYVDIDTGELIKIKEKDETDAPKGK